MEGVEDISMWEAWGREMKKHTLAMAAFSESHHELTVFIKDEDIHPGPDDLFAIFIHCDSKL